jgi:hypothetical protein
VTLFSLTRPALLADNPILTVALNAMPRKAEAGERLALYLDQQTDALLADLKRQFAKPEKFQLVVLNVVRKIVNTLATVYQHPATRELADATDADTALLQEIAASLPLDVKLKTTNRFVKLCKTVAVRVAWRNGRLALDVVTPNILDVEESDDPARPTWLLVTNFGPTDRIEEVTYSFWSATEHFRLDYRGRRIADPENPAGVNPYGVIPFGFFFDRDPDQTFLAGGDDLISAQRAINLKLTDLLRTIQFQSFGIPYTKGLNSKSIPEFGPDRAVDVPTGGDFGFARPEAPIGEVVEAIDWLIKQTAITNGLSPDALSIETRTGESGAARFEANRTLLEARRDDVELYRLWEANLFDVIKAVWNAHNPTRRFSDACRLAVDYADPEQFASAAERMQTALQRIELGVWSPVDALLSENPDIASREEALAIIQRNREETNATGLGAATLGAMNG